MSKENQSDISDEFRDELEALINKHSMENGSDTPDHMLSGYLCYCLQGLDFFVRQREEWYGRKTSAPETVNEKPQTNEANSQ